MPAMDMQQQIEPEKLHAYIKERVLPAVGGRESRYLLEPVKSGSRNLIWFLTIAGGGRYVLKAISKRFRIKNILWAHAYLERRGIPVPGLLFADRAWKTVQSMGYYFSCEQRIDGTPLDALGDRRAEHIAQLTALFARMHATRSLRWGKIKSFQFFGFRDYILRKSAERVQALDESGCTLPGSSLDELSEWFERKQSVMRALGGFSLCHGDVNMKNILLCPDAKIRLIDTEAFKFLPFPIEYFRLAYAQCGFDEELLRKFKETYAAAAPRQNQQELERCGSFYQAYVLLEIAWHFNKKMKREGLPEPERAAILTYRSGALERLAAIAGTAT